MAMQFNRPWHKSGIFLAASALLMGLFVLINYQRGPAQTAGSNSAVGKGNHSFVLRGRLLGGGHLNTAQWKGKVIVVDFWGTWCPWCVREAPHIAKLYAKYHRHGLEVVGVPLNDTAAALRGYRKAHPKESWPQIFDKHPGNDALAQNLGISGLPTDLIIGRRGILRHVVVGYAPDQIATDVRKLLAKIAPAH